MGGSISLMGRDPRSTGPPLDRKMNGLSGATSFENIGWRNEKKSQFWPLYISADEFSTVAKKWDFFCFPNSGIENGKERDRERKEMIQTDPPDQSPVFLSSWTRKATIGQVISSIYFFFLSWRHRAGGKLDGPRPRGIQEGEKNKKSNQNLGKCWRCVDFSFGGNKWMDWCGRSMNACVEKKRKWKEGKAPNSIFFSFFFSFQEWSKLIQGGIKMESRWNQKKNK